MQRTLSLGFLLALLGALCVSVATARDTPPGWGMNSGQRRLFPGFLGHALGTACYIINDPEFGWQAFGGALTQRGTTITVTPQDSLRQRVFIAPLKLWLVLHAGQFEKLTLDTKTKSVTLTFPAKTEHAPIARLRIEGQHKPTTELSVERGAVVVELQRSATSVVLEQ